MPVQSRLQPVQKRLGQMTDRLNRAARYERMAWARRAPLKDDTVFYESFSGNGMLCNPEAIFRGLLASPDLAHLKHIWVLSDLEQYSATVAEFAENPRVSFVLPNSLGYFVALASSKYLVNNATFPHIFAKRDGQVYLNTWHGTPLKAMGYEVPDGATVTTNVVRNFASADYLIAPNDRTEEMYLDAYRMRNIFRGSIIATGTPRIDRQFASEGDRARLRSTLRRRGVSLTDEQQIVLYAPTWKGDFYAPTNDVQQLRNRVEAIRARIDTDKYALLLKVHQQVYKYALEEPDLRTILVPNEMPTNDALAVTDVLVTDYSSIFIDFLATGRPVLFFGPDLDRYASSRGLSLAKDAWPGPITTTLPQLADQLNLLGTGGVDDPAVKYADAYADARAAYCEDEDGGATARVIDIVFRGKTEGYDVRTDFGDGRIPLLMYLGGMLPNGITTSALNLLDNIDHDRFDVSVCYPDSRRSDRLALINTINKRARLFPRVGGLPGTKLEIRALSAEERTDRHPHAGDLERHRDVLEGEYRRLFGVSHFDYIVDFSGYSAYWNKFLMQGDPSSYSIWLHNDLAADAAQRDIHRANLEGIFSLYQFADHLVSVSPSLADVNREKLGEYAPAERFTFARNTINFRRILHLAYGVSRRANLLLDPDNVAAISDPEHSAALDGDLVEEFHPLNLPGSIERLMSHHSIADIRDESERKLTINRVMPAAPGVRTFITVGRLSTEKNHERLIRAFDLVHQENPKTRLVILGSGPLGDHLAGVVGGLGLTDAVMLAGHLPNPYGVMAQADCFVLSSDYEGQPMVLLEALVLGRPVITTSFGSVAGALPKGYGRIVKRDVGALADGMRAFLRGEIESPPFDYVEYNRAATEEFYRAIGAQ